MSFAARHSKGSVFQCNTDGFEYFSLKQLFDDNGADEVYQIQGLYINLKGWNEEGDVRGVWEGGDIGVPMVDSC